MVKCVKYKLPKPKLICPSCSMKLSGAKRLLSPVMAAPSPGSCPRWIDGNKKSTERWRVSSSFESEPARSPLRKLSRHAKKDGSTDAVRARYVDSGLLGVSG